MFCIEINIWVMESTNAKIRVKTSNLEDQYMRLFNLAVRPEEPLEIHVFEKCWIIGKYCPNMLANLRRNGSRI